MIYVRQLVSKMLGLSAALLFVSIFLQVTAKPLVFPDGVSYQRVENGYLFEGDIIMTKEEIQAAIDGKDIDAIQKNDNAYGLVGSTRRRWSRGVVPYELTDSVLNSALNAVGLEGPTEKAIRNAIKTWEANTCIKFVPRTNERDYIKFIDDGFGKCYSYVGRIGGGQKLSLGFGCFTAGVAMHEIGHALGFQHEQSRPDRDSYVEIIWDNIKEGNKHNFKKYSRSLIDSKGSPYDYGSIMHYGKRAFAKLPWMTTIRTRKDGAVIGNRDHLSPQDILQIKRAYSCKM